MNEYKSDRITDPNAPKEDRLREIRKKFDFVKSCDYEKTWRENAVRWLNYFTGSDQGWDEDGARSALEGEGRPALTLNHIHPIVRLVCGAKPDVQTTYMAVEEGDLQTADILNSCKDHVDDINKWKFQESDLLKLAVVLGRVGVSILPDYSKDPRGEVKVELEDGWNIYPDPDGVKKDRSDAMYLFLVKPVYKEWLVREWPDKEEDIDSLVREVEGVGSKKTRDKSTSDGYTDENASDYYNADTKKFNLVVYWYKEFIKAVKVIDLATGEVKDAKPGVSKSEVERRLAELGPEAIDRFSVMERKFTKVKYITFMGNTIFEEGDTPWERQDGQRTELSDNIPIIVDEPDRIVFGGRQELINVIEMLQDPQKYHNKLASAILHIINTSAKSGYDIEEGAISPENKKKLESEGSKPGSVTVWNSGALSSGKVQQKKAGNVPIAEMQMSREMTTEMLDMSGVESLVSTKSLGKSASGVAIDLKQRQGGNIIDWIYSSHSFYCYRLAEFERDAIQALYDYEKVIRIRGKKGKYVRINEQVMDEVGAISSVLNDVTSGSFDVQIREKQSLPSIRVERLRSFSEMVKSGALALPPEVITEIVLNLMDDPELKDDVENELGEYMMKQQQALEQASQGAVGGAVPGEAPGSPMSAPILQPQMGA